MGIGGNIALVAVAAACVAMADPDPPHVLVSTTDWMQARFPWQAPEPDAALTGALRVTGCAGEYEPVTFSVFRRDRDLRNVDVRVSGPLSLQSEGAEGSRIPATNVTVLAVRTLRRETLGEAAFIDLMPDVPEQWKRHSPELLVPLEDIDLGIPRGQSQRFYVDVRLPDDAAPGIYAGELHLRAAGQLLARVPLECEVLPFALSPAPCKYWMWRLTWSPIWQPENVACLRDIAEHGFSGLARACGAGFRFTMGGDGRIVVDDSEMRRLTEVLVQSGLEPDVRDTGIAGALLPLAARHVGVDAEDYAATLPDLEAYVVQRRKHLELMGEAARERATAGDETIQGLAEGEADDGGLVEGLLAEETPRPPPAYERTAAQEAAELNRRIGEIAIPAFREVGERCADMGLRHQVFPIDEPCGTPWKRAWTAYAAGLARDAGLETFSTLNNFTWESNIDHGAAGGMLNAMHEEPALVTNAYAGDLRIAALPWIGAFRGGAKYHFSGLLDEVRIYSRALTDEEIHAQHESPAAGGLVAYYPFDGPDPARAEDRSGEGNHASLVGGASRAPGRVGEAIHLNGVDQHVEPPPRDYDLRNGWSASLWYRGSGSLFGKGYEFYTEGAASVRYTTTEQDKQWARIGGRQDRRFWAHFTLVFDPASGLVKAYVEDGEIRKWHRDNVRWNYVQVRSMPPKNPRFKTGVMAWHYANFGALGNMTTFCYDWNTNHLYVAYPRNGDRFADDIRWYRTVGWEGTREGIDDARYLQTLVDTLEKQGSSQEEALETVSELLSPVTGSYRSINRVISEFGGYNQLRRRIVEAIVTAMESGE